MATKKAKLPMTELEKNYIEGQSRKMERGDQRVRDMKYFNSRMEDAGMCRFMTMVQEEAAREKEFQERTDHGGIVNARKKREEDLGIAIAKERDGENMALLRRQYVRENAPELKNLMKNLRSSYVSRDQKQQILRNTYKKFQEKQEELKVTKILNESLMDEVKAYEIGELKKIQQQAKYCKELQEQIVNTYARKQCQYEDTLIEKKMLDDIMQTIYDEDMKELQKKHNERAQMQRDIKMTQAAKEAWKIKQKKLIVLEQQALHAQQIAAENRAANVQAHKDKLQMQKEAIGKKIADEMIAEALEKAGQGCGQLNNHQVKREEHQNFIIELAQNEALEKTINDGLAEAAKLKKVKADTMRELTTQMKDRLHREAIERIKDEQFRQHIESQILEDDKKEFEKQRKKKEKQLQYTKDLRKQMQENEAKKKKMKEADESMTKYVLEYELNWNKEVMKERDRIIEEHAPHVLGYLQAGVIQREDLPTVRRGADKHEHLASMDIESIAKSKARRTHPKCNAQCLVLKSL